MKKEITIIEKGECPLDAIARLGSETANTWIFLHKNARKQLNYTCDKARACIAYTELLWHETTSYPKTLIRFENTESDWARVYYIEADDIDFKYEPADPEHIFFLKMEER